MSWGPCVGVLGRFFVEHSLVCGSGIPFLGCDCMTVDSCTHLKQRSTYLWLSCWSGVELRVVCPVCRMLVYWLCFVACMVWVTEGQLKKRVQVI